ncbi:MAG: Lrp/AsnC family transcriptional regulator [Acidobacteria bacterium]|nr:Lrp/AsnC family transcriptional regulator [Acidobacteriota bacterium]
MHRPLDRIDFELLAMLQNDARRSNKELAAAVDLAPSACLARVQRLRQAGILRGFHADVEPQALGIGVQAMISVRLRQHGRAKVRAFWKRLSALKEIRAIFHVTGAHDFLVHVAARDIAHLRDLALDAFTNREDVAHIETSIVFEHFANPIAPRLESPEAP